MRVSRSSVAAVAAILLLATPAAASESVARGLAGGPTDLLPDMRMAQLYDMELETRPNGRVRLHFGTIGWNMGDGPLEVRGKKADPGANSMQVKQRIYDSEGGYRTRQTSAVMFFDGDGHGHWHVRQFMHVQLYRQGDPSGDVYGLRKLGYCPLDAIRRSNPPPGSPPTRQYPAASCGVESDTFVLSGISVGWGDDYPPFFAHQWMDITGLPHGDFRMCATVDPLGDFAEKNETNNQRWTDVHIDLSMDEVFVLDTGVGACGPGVP